MEGDQSSAEVQRLYLSLGQKMEPAPEYREIPRGTSGYTVRTGRRSFNGNLYKRYPKCKGLVESPFHLVH